MTIKVIRWCNNGQNKENEVARSEFFSDKIRNKRGIINRNQVLNLRGKGF